MEACGEGEGKAGERARPGVGGPWGDGVPTTVGVFTDTKLFTAIDLPIWMIWLWLAI